MKGTLVGNTKYNGFLSFSQKMKQNFLAGQHQSDLQLNEVEFQHKNSPLIFGFQSLNGQINDNKILVKLSLLLYHIALSPNK